MIIWEIGKMNNKTIIALMTMTLLAGAGAYLLCRKNGRADQINMRYIEIRDTVIIEKISEPVIIEKIIPKIIYKRDTIIKSAPFEARIDTVIKRDTIKAAYYFPENMMSLELRKKPDSILTVKEIEIKEIEKKSPWWESPAIAIGGALMGYLLGHIK